MRKNPQKASEANVRRNPGAGRQQSGRTRTSQMSGRNKDAGVIAACILLPPIGVPYMWAMQRCTRRSRIIVSIISALLLFSASFMFFSGTAGSPDPVAFAPGAGSVYAPASITAQPTAEPAPTELPYDVVVAPTNAPTDAPADAGDGAAATPDTQAFTPDVQATEAPQTGEDGGFVADDNNSQAGQTAAGDTTVYTNDGALFYHSSASCGGKDYSTAISLSDALAQGLAPCNNCNPPASVNG